VGEFFLTIMLSFENFTLNTKSPIGCLLALFVLKIGRTFPISGDWPETYALTWQQREERGRSWLYALE
jgi:hypothetical protein